MAKCRMLIQENQELGRQLSQGRIAQLEAELALQKKYSEELKSSQDGKGVCVSVSFNFALALWHTRVVVDQILCMLFLDDGYLKLCMQQLPLTYETKPSNIRVFPKVLIQ